MKSSIPVFQNEIGILTGPTASGKTQIAIELCQNFGNIEIINADSLLVYRGMDIGTAKPTSIERQCVPHHLIDIKNPDENFTAADFANLAQAKIHEIHSKNRRVIIVGGTGFYLNSLLFGLWDAPPTDHSVRDELRKLSAQALYEKLQFHDSEAAKKIGASDHYRLVRALEIIQISGKTPTELQANLPKTPHPQFHLWIIDRETQELNQRIQTRTEKMIKDGFLEEYTKLSTLYPNSRVLSAVGYSQISRYLNGVSPPGRKIRPGMDGLLDEIQLATRQLVKQQRTWYRNQMTRVSQSRWFILDRERLNLEEAFKKVYD